MFQTFKILKLSRHFAKVGLDLSNNALDNILNCQIFNNYKQIINVWLVKCIYEK